MFHSPFITNKTKQSSFKSGFVVRVENGEMRHQLKPKNTKEDCITCLHSSKRGFSCPLLQTRQSVLVLKVDVSYRW